MAVPAGEGQRWEIVVRLASEPAGVPAYLRAYLLGADGRLHAQLAFTLVPQAEVTVLSRVLATVADTAALRLEAGITGTGRLILHALEAYRRYPRRALRLDEQGRVFVRRVDTVGEILAPVRLAGPVLVDVQATVTADFRDLTPARDGVRVYGSSAVPLATTAAGLAQVQVAERGYRESVESVVATAVPAATAAQDVSTTRLYSFAVLNSGAGPALVRLEISPNGSNWVADTPEQEVAAGNLLVLAPRFFLRYTRLVYRAPSPTPLTVWFQTQS